MNTHRSLIIALSVASVIIIGSVIVNVFWFVPQLHVLRTNIDNNRASIALAKEQRSNLDQLSRDLDSIKQKQTSLESQEWQFLNEDQFFQFFETLGKTTDLTVDAPNISEATPDGTVLTRTVSIKLLCPLATCLDAVTKIQKSVPLIAILRLTIGAGKTTGMVSMDIEATTLWQ
jgi:hypothetical protein